MNGNRKGKILCIMCWVKAVNHFIIHKSDTGSVACYWIFLNNKNFFSKVDGLRKWYENDTVYMKFSLRPWLKSVSWKENKNKTFRPRDPAAAALSCARLLLVSAVTNGKNGAAAVSMHTQTIVNISSRPPVSANTSLFQLRWQKLFIAHLRDVITEIYLSLHPYLQPKLITQPPISSLCDCELVLF